MPHDNDLALSWCQRGEGAEDVDAGVQVGLGAVMRPVCS